MKKRSQENQPKHIWKVVLINNKSLTKEQGNVLGKSLELDTNSFPHRKILCHCGSCGMSFNYISELVIDKNSLGKKTNEFNACGKLLLNIKHEKTHTREKNEFFKSGKIVSHNEDSVQLEKIQTLEQNFAYNIHQETFNEKVVFNTYKTEITEENDCAYDEYGRRFCDSSSFLFHQITASKENHCEFGDCGKSS